MSDFDEFVKSLDTSTGTWLECLVGPDVFSNASGKTEVVPTSASSGKYIGLYFSAKRCGPCKLFTPVLRKSYEEWKKLGKHQFEIIFMSLDRTPLEFNDYFASMPWLASQQLKMCQRLTVQLPVTRAPTLLIVSPEGKLVTSDGAAWLRKDPEGNAFPWDVQNQQVHPVGVWVPLLALLPIYYFFRCYFKTRERKEA